MRGPAALNRHRVFWLGLLLAALLGGVIRFELVLSDRRQAVGGDGFIYHLEALRLADGLGYTSALGDVGAETAHHPPGWTTLLAGAAMLGARSLRAHQFVGVAIGLGLVGVVGCVGRRYFGPRVGVWAAFLAALYPGFWVFEAQILAEPMSLLLLGLLMLGLRNLQERPTLLRSVTLGSLCGLAALVRSELIMLLFVAVLPMLGSLRPLRLAERGKLALAAVLTAALPLAPWVIHNGRRFENAVLLSTNLGTTLLAGNCPPAVYSGGRIGYFDARCSRRLLSGTGLDRSQASSLALGEALSNMSNHVDALPLTVLARLGRSFGVFRPGQTVALTRSWFRTEASTVWVWVVSFWLVVPFAAAGAVRARREGVPLMPLLAPLLIVAIVVTVTYGELRYRAPADLGIVVLAAAALESSMRSRLAVMPAPS